ncbi:hypothetical protein [Limnoglobus roseus]|uniref:Cytochrome C n=1 Tax=Limnoglobus roseus TaxID=2598579 RepID=A0A5C1AHY0_9BACT|nr:hypothetical protein [Limnoglobus roseus]QEL16734.1 hypothetical protein PX52LOC_03700 [Limnoglobus roseus]
MNRVFPALIVSTLVVFLILAAKIVATPPDGAAKPKADTAAKPAEPNPLRLMTRKEAMALKLKNSQVVLEGIALNDFALIEKAAQSLTAVSDLTEFLNACKGTEYQHHVRLFREPAAAIRAKAKDRNMDGVVLAYTDLTLSCLKCHQAMRDKVFEVDRGGPADDPKSE